MGIKPAYKRDYERAIKESASGKPKTYSVRIFANEDVYESTVLASRLTIAENNIILYNHLDQVIAVYPSRITEIILKK